MPDVERRRATTVRPEAEPTEATVDPGEDTISEGLSDPLGGQLSDGLSDSTVQLDAAVQHDKDPLPTGDDGFDKMWEAHPHNYQDDESENTSSDEVREEEGLPAYLENTCAIRMSVMLNNLGGSYAITPKKVKSAGIKRAPWKGKKQADGSREYFIVSAKEMWTYLDKYYRSADVMFPASGKFANEEEFNQAWEEGDNPIKDLVGSKKGIVAFEKIFGYGGTGHVDLFNGLNLSDASDWYPSQKLHLWYVTV